MKKDIIILILIIIFISNVSALISTSIDVKEVFYSGEKAKFDYTFVSDRDEELTFIPSIKCIGGFESILEERSLSLKKSVPTEGSYEGFDVSTDTLSQQCIARVQIKRPFMQIKEEDFNLNARSSFGFEVLFCKSSSCLTESKVFIKGERVYLDYSSSVENPVIKAKLTYPDETSKDINLPYSFKSGQIGTYNLDVSAVKQGYNNVSKQEIFGVIEKQAEISSIDENGNDVSLTTSKENNVSILIDKIKEFNPLVLIVVLVIIAGVVVLAVILYLTRKKGIKERDEPYI